MANTKSIKKVQDYLEKNGQEEYISATEISIGAVLKSKSVKEVLEILRENKKILIAKSKGGTLLVKLMGEQKC